ncbi:hypothetical protein [uncultured Herbaspirillum sp.]|uniref:hypothetical protein n=1 Tax=uncultured Herbaspirillum sp. TaxID=160236 RepID=UPI0025859F81|nr:hypothetical protein [uncultured Herbaspirillum sp.]
MSHFSSSGVAGRFTTIAARAGIPIGLSAPLDRGYICEKICMCEKGTEIVDRLGRKLKQRCTTKRIQADEEVLGQLAWRYKAEVGYYMSNPARPLMSEKQPNRPSRFPIGRAIKEGLLLRDFEGRYQKGVLRIPDVTILKITGAEIAAMRASGKIDWSRFIPIKRNIETILEIKFAGDSLTENQLKDYPKIAGKKKFRLLESHECGCERERKRVPMENPVRNPITTPMPRETTEARRWSIFPPLKPTPAPAPQPLRPSYGPVVELSDGIPLSRYLRSGAKIVGGVVVIAGSIAAVVYTVGASTPGSAEGIAAGVALIVTGVALGSSATALNKD